MQIYFVLSATNWNIALHAVLGGDFSMLLKNFSAEMGFFFLEKLGRDFVGEYFNPFSSWCRLFF